MDIDLTNRVYKVDDKVYKGYTPLTVQNQRGRLFIKYRGTQVNLKDIPVLPQSENDCVYNYIFDGGSINYACPAMDYWIYRHRMGNRISVKDYAVKFSIKLKKK